MSTETTDLPSFKDLTLSAPVLKALNDVGYEMPTPIQARTIPYLIAGHDVLGQAQTGTGKTAAFALPLLSRLDIKNKNTQCLILTPTRELAIQVAEAFQRYAVHLRGFHIVPIYGGQDYSIQFRHLKRGAHVVVGTPGRVMDHMRRGTLKLETLSALVLDEADEMLRMGFIDDVEWILDQTPPKRQVALFSATMPKTIQRIAGRYMQNPKEVLIETPQATVSTVRQRAWLVSGVQKLDALTRILEVEAFEGMIIFVRTKIATVELSEKLQARGYSSLPLNGDLSQTQRERTVEKLKRAEIDILVATDVAARGLDIDRISHVVNYDVPHDAEAYVHRIGRTARAGREGDAILFVTLREKRMLYSIEKMTRQKIEMMELPSTQVINDKRIDQFKQRITDALTANDLTFFYQLIEQYQQEHEIPTLNIAAALAKLAQGDIPLLLKDRPKHKKEYNSAPKQPIERSQPDKRKPKPKRSATTEKLDMEQYRIEVGKADGVKPANIVGAIANEAALDGAYIANITIHEDFSTVDLPCGMPIETLNALKKAWVCSKKLDISLVNARPESQPTKRKSKSTKVKTGKKNK